MGETLLYIIVFLAGSSLGASVPYISRAIRDVWPKPPEEEKKSPALIVSSKALRSWLRKGRNDGILKTTTLDIDDGKPEELHEWLKNGPSHVFQYKNRLADGERLRLWIWFWGVLAYLVVIGVVSAVWMIIEAKQPAPDRLILTLVAGIFGSSVAAFRSCLDRRANGLEDQYGNVSPGDEAKERFSDGMVVWFLGRPALGGAVGLLVYVGLLGGVFSIAVKQEILEGDVWKFVFYMSLVGLFAKTLLDLFLGAVKKVFRI